PGQGGENGAAAPQRRRAPQEPAQRPGRRARLIPAWVGFPVVGTPLSRSNSVAGDWLRACGCDAPSQGCGGGASPPQGDLYCSGASVTAANSERVERLGIAASRLSTLNHQLSTSAKRRLQHGGRRAAESKREAGALFGFSFEPIRNSRDRVVR